MIDTISTILNSIVSAVAYSVLAWVTVMLPTSIALAYRRGWNLAYGAACATLPIIGWLIIWFNTRDSAENLRGRLRSSLDRVPSSSERKIDY